MKTVPEPNHEIPVVEEVNVPVVGGGPARDDGPRVGVVIAMRAEATALFASPAVGSITTYVTERGTVGLLISGIGARRARAAAERLCAQFRPNYLVSLGVCGAVDERLAVGDLVVADRVLRGGDSVALASPHAKEALAVARQAGGTAHLGAVQTFDRPLLSRHGLGPGVLGVDIECYAVAEVAHEHGLPAVAVKAISDVVPERATPRTVSAWLWHFRAGFAVARLALAGFADLYFRAVSR